MAVQPQALGRRCPATGHAMAMQPYQRRCLVMGGGVRGAEEPPLLTMAWPMARVTETMSSASPLRASATRGMIQFTGVHLIPVYTVIIQVSTLPLIFIHMQASNVACTGVYNNS